MSVTSVCEAKSSIRRRVRETRARRPAAERLEAAVDLATVVLQISQVREARRVAAYASTATEPGTAPLLSALRAAGKQVILPLVRPGRVLDWAAYDGALLPSSGLGGPEPTGRPLGPGAIGQVDVVIAPALAVDTLGRRLGQGGGFYDTALTRADPQAPVVALLFEGEVLDAAIEAVPAEEHDCVVDAVATPRRFLPLHPGAGLSAWLSVPVGGWASCR